MNEYLGCECSVCRKPFAAGDDIVVCPECGTPYHRACYEAAGGCVHEAQHAAGYAWRAAGKAAAGGFCGRRPAERAAHRRRAARLPFLRCAKPSRGAVLRKLRHAPFGPRRQPAGPCRRKPLCAAGRPRAGLWAARVRRTARLGCRRGTAGRQLRRHLRLRVAGLYRPQHAVLPLSVRPHGCGGPQIRLLLFGVFLRTALLFIPQNVRLGGACPGGQPCVQHPQLSFHVPASGAAAGKRAVRPGSCGACAGGQHGWPAFTGVLRHVRRVPLPPPCGKKKYALCKARALPRANMPRG